MKKFSFRLKHVLNYRKNLEKLAQRELYYARNEYLESEKTIYRMKAKKKAVTTACRQREQEGINVPQYQIYKRYLYKMDGELDDAQAELQKIGEKIEKKTEKLKQALVKKKTLEIMKKTRYENHIKAYEKESQNALDELVILNRGSAR